ENLIAVGVHVIVKKHNFSKVYKVSENAAKTEYSQEKYIRKKERKYMRFLTVCRPTIVSLHEMLTVCLLYDSGCQGLPAAAMFNRIGENTSGHLINLHPGNVPQTAIVQAMNFPQELRDRHVAVNIYSFLRLHYQGESSVLDISTSSKKVTDHIVESSVEKLNGETKSDEVSRTDTEISELETDTGENSTLSLRDAEKDADTLKRKLDESEEAEEAVPVKKPKWFLETQRALDLLNSSKARGLTVIAKEHPLNIVNALLPFPGASRPFVIFHTYRELLQETLYYIYYLFKMMMLVKGRD
ncbi:trna adenine-n-methyltransferase non-catalytic subunit trm6, partial [Lasius niger]